MPKRGGRKSHPRKDKGGGGGGSNFGRFKTNKNKKKTGQGSSKNHGTSRSTNIDIPELMDLDENVYIPEIDAKVSRNSMKNLSRRPGRHHLYEEVGYTDKHIEDTLRQPLRNRPIEFVKAKQVYDPSAELFKKLGKSGIPKIHQELLDSMNSPPVQEAHVPESPTLDILSEESENDAIHEVATHLTSSNTSLDSNIENRGETLKNADDGQSGDEAEQTEDTEEEREIENDENENYKIESESERDEEEEEEEEDAFVIDDTGDAEIAKNLHPVKPMTSLLIQSKLPKLSTQDHVDSIYGGVEYDPVLNIGKVSLQTKKDANGQSTAELMSVNHLNKISTKGFIEERKRIPNTEKNVSDISDDDFGGYKDYIAQVMRDGKLDVDSDEYESETNFDIMASSSSSEEENDDDDNDGSEKDPSEIEYGFLPEDYEFDVSQVSISNVRFGIKNQFYTKCAELTGSDDQSMWLDEDDLVDYVLLKGVKEHRLDSFMKFITKGLIDEELIEVPNYSDVYISETSEEEEETNDDDENLAAMIAFTKSQQQSFMDLDIPSTERLKTKGLGKKKQLDLDRMQLDIDMRESLQDQYQVHREAKRSKKQRREEARLEEGIARHDLLIKYPYSLHIKDISNEFEVFLHDTSRDSMNFPPLDPHGNKTIIKISNFYNMKSLKCGTGLKLFIKVSKNRKTFHYLPRYDQIGSVLRQRPIFNRTDQKRPKDEITRSDGNSKKDRSRGRNKSQSNAQTREGEIVGASAPEIGANNIGRQLLEKLGWSKGEGLGAHGNKGISEPVVAKIKKSKTGLK
ncbi:Protein SQS1 [Debaryomyces fabryi]|uniref:Protein SQS1 n=1 Tax=Debaryomyces fabryi TaxID=58627 RepID=A0A0V1Q0R5_9ASCO|nr:Protein SQS1 [Debaryomyces fabryi]KSA02087.1 Protein SQS1 [Debaryomyces fabryi]CUM51127.1 unnamed protein product [Debaryomyces fabryi]